jgi:hypothetical protein
MRKPAERQSILDFWICDFELQGTNEIAPKGLRMTQPFGPWFGLAPDDSPIVLRNLSSEEVYALDMQWP